MTKAKKPNPHLGSTLDEFLEGEGLRSEAMAIRNPVHPGDFIRTEIINPLGLTVSDASTALGVHRATLSDLLNGHAALTPEMALRIEKAFGPDMDMLLRMQLAYDVAQVRQRAAQIDVKRFEPRP